MKKIYCLLLMLILCFALFPQSVSADDSGAPVIILNDSELVKEACVQEGLLYLPVRAICQSLGYDVKWIRADQSALISSDGKIISLNLKEYKITAADHTYYTDYMTIKDSTYMPADFFSDNFSLKVSWNKAAGKVLLENIKENDISISTVKESSENSGLKITLQYPRIDGLENRLVQDEINALFQQLAEDAAGEGRKNAADLAEYNSKNPGSPNPCETYFDYRVRYNQKDMISLAFQDYQYAGGAHGMTLQTSYTINLKTGEQYALKDLFKKGADYTTAISSEVKTQLQERNLTVALFAPFEKISDDQPYYLSPNGIVVYFQQYEILPYAAGIQEFTTDFSLLDGLLDYSF